MRRPRPIITLLTDFGAQDTYVGVVKGVLLSHASDAALVDLTHDVPPQDVRAASYHLATAWRWFPPGTIHLAVVDPGVGSARRAIAARSEGHLFVAPDNGLLAPTLGSSAWTAVDLSGGGWPTGRPVSSTFHARDIFAPAAGRLARGAPVESLGPEVRDLVGASTASPLHTRTPGAGAPGRLESAILHVDHFGNVILDAGPADLRLAGLERAARLALHAPHRSGDPGGAAATLRVVTHYAAADGALCCLVNSEGRLEIALPGGSAARALQLERGDPVALTAAGGG